VLKSIFGSSTCISFIMPPPYNGRGI
jgi:hypothetical protein